MKVSIVLPVYNQQTFLETAMNGVISQTYSDIEILIVNDGSTDNSLEIVERYAISDRRIRIINQPNSGLLAANVTGITQATGEYICFYDPDDRIGPNYVERFVNELDDKYDFVARGITYEYPDRVVDFPLKENRVFTQEQLRLLSSNYILDSSMKMDNKIFVARWNKMYRTALLKEFVEEYAECRSVSLGEDSIFTYLLLQHAKNGKACVAPSSYRYVQHASSMTHAVNLDTLLEKCLTTYNCFSNLINRYTGDLKPAKILFCSQVTGALAAAVDAGLPTASNFYTEIATNELYRDALACAHSLTMGRNLNIELLYRKAPFALYSNARRAYRAIKSR